MGAVKPRTVMLELCAGRYVNIFADSNSASPQEETEVSDVGGLAGALTQANRLSDRVGITAGVDFSAALEEAVPLKARVVLGDVDAFVTVEQMAGASNIRALLPALFSPKLFIQVAPAATRVGVRLGEPLRHILRAPDGLSDGTTLHEEIIKLKLLWQFTARILQYY